MKHTRCAQCNGLGQIAYPAFIDRFGRMRFGWFTCDFCGGTGRRAV